MTINEIMEQYHLSRSALSDRFGIPYRTVQNWSLGIRQCPEYIIAMINEILSNESQD